MKRKVNLKMPKFKMSYKKSLVDTYKNLGITRIFDFSYDFSKIGSMELKVDNILHQTFIKVDEEGTEASAFTGIIMTTRCAPIMRPPIEFILD